MTRVRRIIPATLVAVFLFASCQGGSSGGTVRVDGNPGSSFPETQFYTAIGSGPSFQDARQDAYTKVLIQAAQFIMGSKFEENKSAIIDNYCSYRRGRQFVVGEQDPDTADPNKAKKLTPTGKDDSGNTLIKIEAWIYTRKMKEAIEGLGISTETATKPATTTTTTTPPTTTSTTTTTTTTTSKIEEDLSDVDVAGLSAVVYFKPKGLTAEQETYSKIAAQSIINRLRGIGIDVKDLETMETLAKERSLLQEESEGSIELGLLLAQKVAAELYVEVWTTVGYGGDWGQATVNITVKERTTGDVLSEIQQGGRRGEGASSQMNNIRWSINKALDGWDQAGTKVPGAVARMRNDIARYIKKGRVYFIRLTGVSNRKDARAFSRAIEGASGVVSVDNPAYAGGVSDYYVRFKGNPGKLEDTIFDTLEGQPGFENFDLSSKRGNELIFKLE